jgi:hypothetical protein
MGPYCNYCGRRCFLPRIIPDGPRRGESLILATCERGMAHDQAVTGHTHKTAINPVTDPEAACRAGTGLADGLDDFLVRVPDHHNDLGDWCPRSGEYSADGTCPLFCREADDIMGIDAGRDEDEDEAAGHRHDGGCTWAGCGSSGLPDTLREARERS